MGDSCTVYFYYNKATEMYIISNSEYLHELIYKICHKTTQFNAFSKSFSINLCLNIEISTYLAEVYTKEDLYKQISL